MLYADDFLFSVYRPESEAWFVMAARQLGNVCVGGPYATREEVERAIVDVPKDRRSN